MEMNNNSANRSCDPFIRRRNPADCAKQKLFKESGANEETKNPGNG